MLLNVSSPIPRKLSKNLYIISVLKGMAMIFCYPHCKGAARQLSKDTWIKLTQNKGVQNAFGEFCRADCEKKEITDVGEQAILEMYRAPPICESLNECW